MIGVIIIITVFLLVGKKDKKQIFIDSLPSYVGENIKKLEANINSLKSDASAYAKVLLEKDTNLYPLFTNLGEEVLSGVCANAGISYLKAYDNKAKLEAFFSIVNKANKNLFNDSLPEDELYYK